MEKNGVAKAAVVVAVVALLVAVVSLLSAPADAPEQTERSDPVDALRAEIASLKDSVKLCQAAGEASGAERAKMTARLGKLEREVARAPEKARAEVDPELIRDLVKREVDAQLEDGKGDRDAGIRDWFRRIGIADDMISRVRTHFKKSGFSDKQADQALGGMLKVLYQMREEGERYEMDPRLRDYLEEEIGLADKQVQLVEGIARRLVHHLGEEDRRDERPARAPGEKEVF